ncbi:hypothetical protein H696_02388 [Fonticula alba]|uniref:ATP-binding cassette, subfamily B (MDR/TAP), member 6 n=1 Tax=Fonticula alba TaxID=691883 RepID=A0A058ZBY5_FONAL|nr:hypothetical protein H696_02388 [Fonticula alba]KCV71441.1 hypothetical protein H696_02388 [Fonticula alba]|eukprot:XP_009494564.1 hypothetical protein H696_02388 [Fonticula alba]
MASTLLSGVPFCGTRDVDLLLCSPVTTGALIAVVSALTAYILRGRYARRLWSWTLDRRRAASSSEVDRSMDSELALMSPSVSSPSSGPTTPTTGSANATATATTTTTTTKTTSPAADGDSAPVEFSRWLLKACHILLICTVAVDLVARIQRIDPVSGSAAMYQQASSGSDGVGSVSTAPPAFALLADILLLLAYSIGLSLLMRSKSTSPAGAGASLLGSGRHGAALAAGPAFLFWVGALIGVLVEMSGHVSALGHELVSGIGHLITSIYLGPFVMLICRLVVIILIVIFGFILFVEDIRQGMRRARTRASSAAYAPLSSVEDGQADVPTPEDVSGEVASPRAGGVGTAAVSPVEEEFEEWKDMAHRLIPFVWPKDRPGLQFRIVVCIFIIILARLVNMLVPVLNKRIIDAYTAPLTPNALSLPLGDLASAVLLIPVPWGDIVLYLFLKLLQGGGGSAALGMLSNARKWLYMPCSQFTFRMLSRAVFSHLQCLSLAYHAKRKTGEVLRVVDRGTSSVAEVVETVVFSVGPSIIDIGVSIAYFVIAFDVYFGAIVALAISIYMVATVYVTAWRTKFRRVMNERDNALRQTSVDSLLNYETVKLYGAEALEIRRYVRAIRRYQRADILTVLSFILLNSIQNFLLVAGLAGGMILVCMRVSHGRLTIGDLTLFLTYFSQIASPLNWLGSQYRSIQQSIVDAEKMMALMKEPIDIVDSPGAVDLTEVGSQFDLEFENVHFTYKGSDRPSLNGVSFRIPAGKSCALVGSSGSGKSTLLRLAGRLYDVTEGAVKIGGRDVRHVSLESLRRVVGVVPQDVALFDASIRFNIAYGDPDTAAAVDRRIVAAAQAAHIHALVDSLPEGYGTRVGERGVRLSGGEKQRVAIARTLLKNPPVLLLDEATSALDTVTERAVQQSIQELIRGPSAATGLERRSLNTVRTSLVIAHRLSTIVDSDIILVMKHGQIVERGTHESLLAIEGGEYSRLWQEQLKMEQDTLTL